MSGLRFFHFGRVLTIALAIMIIGTSAALARSITFVNNSGKTITEAYLTPENGNYSSNNMIGRGGMSEGRTTVSLGADSQYWSLRVVFRDGSSGSWGGLDLYTNSRITIMPGPECYTSRS